MQTMPKRLFGHRRSTKGRTVQRLCLSLYPAHHQTLHQRELELNVGRSTLIQILLEVEERNGILRRELLTRLRRPSRDQNPKTKEHNDYLNELQPHLGPL